MRAILLAAVMATVASLSGPSDRVLKGDLELVLSTDRPAYALGSPVRLTLEVRNRGNSPLVLTFPTAQRYDFIVTGQDGRTIWQWSHDKAFAQAFFSLTLDPGEARAYRELWDQRDAEGRQVPPGWYAVEGVLTSRPYATLRPRVRIYIGPEAERPAGGGERIREVRSPARACASLPQAAGEVEVPALEPGIARCLSKKRLNRLSTSPRQGGVGGRQ